MTHMAKAARMKEKTDKLDFIKIQKCNTSVNTIKKVKTQLTKWETLQIIHLIKEL